MIAQVAGAVIGSLVLFVIARRSPGFDLAGGLASNGYGLHSLGQFTLSACAVTKVSLHSCSL